MQKQGGGVEEYLFLGGKKHVLFFREKQKAPHEIGKADLEGHEFMLNGRAYRAYGSFPAEGREKLERNAEIRRDVYGSRCLRIYHDIPAFDSGDMEWDDHSIQYLFFDGKEVHLLYVRGGAKIAKMEVSMGLLAADASFQPYFERLGFPEDGITWVGEADG